MIIYPYFAKFERANANGAQKFDSFASAAEASVLESLIGFLGLAFVIGGIVEIFGK
jgi:hypothetical protein